MDWMARHGSGIPGLYFEIRSYGRTGYMKGKAFDDHLVQL